MTEEWTQLSDYIEILLNDGKNSKHPDFEVLFNIFGREKIIKLALEVKEKLKKENEK